MEYLCQAYLGFYGLRHELQLCTGCLVTYCKCTEKLTPCSGSCRDLFCLECIGQFKLVKPFYFCSCRVCPPCLLGLGLFTHGRKCRPFRNSLQIALYAHPKLNADVIDLIGPFLWGELRRVFRGIDLRLLEELWEK